MYPTVDLAFDGLTDPHVFERVASILLLDEHPTIEWTGGSGDRGRDAVIRPALFGDEEIVVQFSLEKRLPDKVRKEVRRYQADPSLPKKMIFVSSRKARYSTRCEIEEKAGEAGIDLRIRDRGWLAPLLEHKFRPVAEEHLNVAPRTPETFVDPTEFARRLAINIPGFDSPLAGALPILDEIREKLCVRLPRVILLSGGGGVGKTRLALAAGGDRFELRALSHGMTFDSRAFTSIPPSKPLILLIDDAHRIDDLSGVRLLLDDSRYDEVRFLLTIRPGFQAQVVEKCRLHDTEYDECSVVQVERRTIDSIVRGDPYRIGNEDIRLSIIAIADGNPLIAHIAAQAASRGKLYRENLASLLRNHLQDLIRGLRSQGGAQQRVLGIVALLGYVRDAELASVGLIAGVGDPECREIINSLADAGIFSVSPGMVHVKPDRLRPILVADTFFPDDAMPLLDPDAVILPELDGGRRRDVLATLSEAVALAGGAAREFLAASVRARRPASGDRDAGRWSDALSEAEIVVGALSDDVVTLLAMFQSVWPVEDEAGAGFARTADHAFRQAVSCARSLERVAATDSLYCLLSLALLAPTHVSDAAFRGQKALYEDVLTHARPLNGPYVTKRSCSLLQTVEAWHADQSEASEACSIAVHAAVLITLPYLEFSNLAPESARLVHMGAFPVPDTAAHRSVVRGAASFVASRLSCVSEGMQSEILGVIDRLRRASLDMPMVYNLSFSSRQRRFLREVVGVMRIGFVELWESVSLAIRRLIVEILGASPTVRKRAKADSALGRFMVLHPVRSGADLAKRKRAESRRARLLARDLGVVDGAALLRDSAEAASVLGIGSHVAVPAFVREVGSMCDQLLMRRAVTTLKESDSARRWIPLLLGAAITMRGPVKFDGLVLELAEDGGLQPLLCDILDDVSAETREKLIEILSASKDLPALHSFAASIARSAVLGSQAKAEQLIRIARSAPSEARSWIMQYFGPSDDSSSIEVPSRLRRSFVKQMRLIAASLDVGTESCALQPAYSAMLEWDEGALLAVVKHRVKAMLRRVCGAAGAVAPTPIPIDLRRALDGIGDRERAMEVTISWVEEFGTRDTWYRVEDAVWELVYVFGAGSSRLTAELLSWVEAGGEKRRLAIRAIRGQWGSGEFDTVGRQLVASGLSDVETLGLLEAADVIGVRDAGDPSPYQARVDYFLQWTNEISPLIRTFGELAKRRFEKEVTRTNERVERLERGH